MRKTKPFVMRISVMSLALACLLTLPVSMSRTAASAEVQDYAYTAAFSGKVTENAVGAVSVGVPSYKAITITEQPEDRTVTVGTAAVFTVKATGVSKYQWQYRANESATWASSAQSGNTTATLSVATTAGLHGYQFRCKMTDASGQTKYSSTVTLYLRPRITSQPADQTAAAGSGAVFTVAATGKATLTYQWQYRKNSSASWANSAQSGNKTATLTVATTTGLHGYQFRCCVTDGNGQRSYSNAATLSVKPGITKQPADKTVPVGSKATFSVSAFSTATLSYQWQYLSPSGVWTNSGQSGCKTATLSVATTGALQGYRFRCIVTDGNGQTYTSSGATLTLSDIPINATYFPDEIFRDYVSENFDTENDGKLSASELSAVNQIRVSGMGIDSLKGVEYFSGLKMLYCDKNYLVSLDLNRNTELTDLHCDCNELTKLSISRCKKLATLHCYENSLTSLDVSSNTDLADLRCHSNKLTALNVSKNTKLRYLRCSSNNLTSLNVSNNTALTYLSFRGNKLTSIDLSKNTKLTSLYCYENNLTSLDLSNNTALTLVSCYQNNLTSINVSKCVSLKELYCFENPLTALDVRKNTALTILSCYSTGLTALNLSNNTALKELNCRSTGLTALNLSNNTELTELRCGDIGLTALDLSKNTKLTYLLFSDNKLTSIDLSKNTALQALYCYRNNLTALDVSKNTKLTLISCRGNALTTLDVSKNTALKELYCGQNKLTALDLSRNTALTNLSCYGNSLTSLNVSRNKSLKDLACYNNKLTSLNVSKNTALKSLWCYGNSLTALDVSANTALTKLYCNKNKLTSLILPATWGSDEAILDCSYNNLTSIDPGTARLYSLDCSHNRLAKLKMEDARVNMLYCYGNSIASLIIDQDDNDKIGYCYVSSGTNVTVRNGEVRIVYVAGN
ncbi:MAG: hypothetical protein J6Y20_02755 [Lachnospiraceae bacterium]|nr:hypothetical protein [Lachnospiraceae bacterium]